MGKKKPPKKPPLKKKKKKSPSPASSKMRTADPASSSSDSPPPSFDVDSEIDYVAHVSPDGSSPSANMNSVSNEIAPVNVAIATVPEPINSPTVAHVKVVKATVPEPNKSENVATVKVVTTTVPEPIPSITECQTKPHSAEETASQVPDKPKDTWCDMAKGVGKKIQKKGSPYTLPSGEVCIDIPNSVIEKNKKSWDCFVLGQFYHDPPSQGTIYKIVNGIWSENYRDITVSKMEGFAFLFCIPNASTRNYVLKQRLWQIEGQTMFVDKWEPGVIPPKPELSSAPIWLELRNVPFQFFNEDGLERIAGLVGDPKFLHPNTANKTVLDVAKVFTIIDPRKPLPEAVNVRFDSGDIARVLVSSPWMPPVCDLCHEIGHTTKRCKRALKSCSICKSTTHSTDKCTRVKQPEEKRKPSRRHKENATQPQWQVRENGKPIQDSIASSPPTKIQEKGDSSGLTPAEKTPPQNERVKPSEGTEEDRSSDLEHDSSDTYSAESDGYHDDHENFIRVLSRRSKKKNRGALPSKH
ncbi:hypothetical protein Bca4012_050813 [Brassica carinata]